jgi:hypothetical protein
VILHEGLRMPTLTEFRGGEDGEQQIPPLRFAPVGMTMRATRLCRSGRDDESIESDALNARRPRRAGLRSRSSLAARCDGRS